MIVFKEIQKSIFLLADTSIINLALSLPDLAVVVLMVAKLRMLIITTT